MGERLKTGLEKAEGDLDAADITNKLEKLEQMDCVSAAFLARVINPAAVAIGDCLAVLRGNVD